jgi:hypothetical protein
MLEELSVTSEGLNPEDGAKKILAITIIRRRIDVLTSMFMYLYKVTNYVLKITKQ